MVLRSLSVLAILGGAAAWPALAQAQATETAVVKAAAAARVVTLPAELVPYQATTLHGRVSGFVEDVRVDRGDVVRQGQTLATLAVPETTAQLAEARSKVQQAETRKVEADTRLATATTMHERLKRAAETPGTVAGIDIVRAEEDVKAARASLATHAEAVEAARAAMHALEALDRYRTITAPFAGRITERFVHPGALAGPSTGPLLRLEQTSRLRLVVPVPEHNLGEIAIGRVVEFRVPSHPGKTFAGKLARSAGSLDARTRTMTVEIDVSNADGALAPGMFADVSWPVVRQRPALLVPPTAVVTTTERTFVIRVAGGVAEWVTVKKGPVSGDVIEVIGDLEPGDTVVRRGSDEIRNGSRVPSK